MQRLIFIFSLFILAIVGCSSNESQSFLIRPDGGEEGGDDSATEIEIGKTIPAWQEGVMDIHFINTTTGESVFVIFPDGTQMLIDAASSSVTTNSNGNTTNTGIRSRWDPTLTSTRGSQIIADYIRKCMAWTGNSTIDYAVLTHFYNDHFGGYNTSLPKSSNSDTYSLIGYAEIFDNFKIGTLLDRGYPDYNYPFDMATMADNASSCNNYINAVKWNVANKKFEAAIFKAGANNQIVQKYNSAKYPTAKVQNVAVNGEIWTGSGTATKKTFPELSEISYKNSKDITASDNCPPENITSCVMKVSYGNFDFFAGGDLQYNGRSSYAWKDAELPCAKAVGQVEVMKADHHGVTNTNQADALKALNPQTIVINSWVDCHPRTDILNSMETTLPACDIFITNFWQGDRPSGVDDRVTAEEAARVKGYDGHIVVRVTDGGNKYRVMTTTDSDGAMTVKAVSGPYTSR